jgi:hypothetical protein
VSSKQNRFLIMQHPRSTLYILEEKLSLTSLVLSGCGLLFTMGLRGIKEAGS